MTYAQLFELFDKLTLARDLDDKQALAEAIEQVETALHRAESLQPGAGAVDWLGELAKTLELTA